MSARAERLLAAALAALLAAYAAWTWRSVPSDAELLERVEDTSLAPGARKRALNALVLRGTFEDPALRGRGEPPPVALHALAERHPVVVGEYVRLVHPRALRLAWRAPDGH